MRDASNQGMQLYYNRFWGLVWGARIFSPLKGPGIYSGLRDLTQLFFLVRLFKEVRSQIVLGLAYGKSWRKRATMLSTFGTDGKTLRP